MTEEKLEGRWNEIREKVQERWGRLTDQDIERLSGKAEELVDTLEARYGYTQQRAEQEVERFLDEELPMLQTKTEQVFIDAQEQVEEHPWYLLFVGMAIGFLLAVILIPEHS